MTVFLRPNRMWSFWSRKLQRPIAVPYWRSRVPAGKAEVASQLATEVDDRSRADCVDWACQMVCVRESKFGLRYVGIEAVWVVEGECAEGLFPAVRV